MKHIEGTFKGAGRLSLYYQSWHPQGQVQGIVVIVHGIGAHSGLFNNALSQVWPRFRLRVGIDHSASSRDPSVVSTYAQDSLRHEYGTARLATEFFAAVNWSQSHISDLQIPLLLLHGSADQVTLPQSSWAFCERVTFPDKECYEYPGSYHDLHADINYREVLADMGNWLERKTARRN